MASASETAAAAATDVIKTRSDSVPASQQNSFEGLLANNITFITRGVAAGQPRLVQRAIAQTAPLRHSATKVQLKAAIDQYVPTTCATHGVMQQHADKLRAAPVDSAMDVEGVEPAAPMPGASGSAADTSGAVATTAASVKVAAASEALPEVEVYLFTLVVTRLLAERDHAAAMAASRSLISRIRGLNRRMLDPLAAKAFFYFSLAHERGGVLESVRGDLMSLYQTACYRRDELSQAVLLNLCLRSYLQYNLTEQAQVLAEKTSAAAAAGGGGSGVDSAVASASNNQYCRYMYYTGRAHAIQLEYGKAFSTLSMALRKSPQDHAFGFTTAVTKLLVLVQLLVGGIPERSSFNHAEARVRAALLPYLSLTKAVRTGNLALFADVVNEHQAAFRADKNHSLVRRLSHNVLKGGLKKISLSYSRIGFADIAEKLLLSSPAAAEFVCAKAIRDGVIEATIDHGNGWLINREVADIYTSEEPQKAFHKRIVFCLGLHNEAVKAMRYPPCDDTYAMKAAKVEDEEAKKRKKHGKDPDDKDKDKDGKGKGKGKGGKNDAKTIDEIIRDLEDGDDEDDDSDMMD